MAEKSFHGINDAPIQGITLRETLTGYKDRICRISWSRDGRYLATPSEDGTVRIWAVNSELYTILQEPKDLESSSLWVPSVYCVAWSPDGKKLATGSSDSQVRVWDIHSGEVTHFPKGHDQLITSLDWSPDGLMLASASDDRSVILWEATSGKNLHTFYEHEDWVTSVAWSPDGKYLASGCADNIIRIWDIPSRSLSRLLAGHKGRVTNLIWNPAGESIISASYDATIKFWDPQSGQQLQSLEGHGSTVRSISISHDCKILASNSWDSSIRLWSLDSLEVIGFIKESVSDNWAENLAFNPRLPLLATLSNHDSIINIWNFESEMLLSKNQPSEAIRYTTAKLILVGDSGVGKTGLGWRLAHNEFKEHSSTHGQQFWVVPKLKKTREDGTQCEAVLWDLAGQHIYRSIHSIFLDDVDASLILFDPTNRQEPLKGAQFWLEQLKGKKQLPPSVLVGARLDRGAPVLSQQELDQFCQKYGVSGGYIGTSAKNGEGLDRLLETLKAQIPWDQMTTTVTTVTFKRIKEYVLKLKEKTDRKGVLVHPDYLRKQLEATDKDWQFADAEMMTAVGHLSNYGYVTILKSSSGDEYILLVPELLASVASSIFLHADKHPRELGAINETELLQGKYPIDEFKGLEKEEQQVLLDATVVLFLEHSLCFRETLGNDNLLIFPSLIKQKRPLQDDAPSTDDVSYIVRGRVENIYAMMVVLLGYTPSFSRINQWANQAQYETREGNICGFRMVADREGEIELVIYYGETVSNIERREFQVLFERFIYQRDVEVQPIPPVRCSDGHLQERAAVIKKQREGKDVIFCSDCGKQINLPDLAAMQTIGTNASKWLEGAVSIARLRSTYEAHLARIKGYRRDWAIPRCYISSIPEQSEWVKDLKDDLGKAGVFVVEEPSQVQNDDFIILLDTLSYQQAWKNGDQVLVNDFKLIKDRLSNRKHKLISIVMEGMPVAAHELENCQRGNFCDEGHYPVSLFDLVLNLYAIPLTHAGFITLRQSLHQQWERNYKESQSVLNVQKDNKIKSNGKEIFISYAWGGESEKLVNELDQAFQNHGVTIVRDKRDLGFKGSIKGFMETIGTGKAVVFVISEKYLKSENCLFELLQVAKYGNLEGRIFPVVLEDARIYKAIDRIRYVRYWEEQLKELDDAMKTVSATNMHGFREDIDLYAEIRANLPRLTDILRDMNTLTPTIHRDEDFKTLFDAVMAKLKE